jgi:hypothetical protein
MDQLLSSMPAGPLTAALYAGRRYAFSLRVGTVDGARRALDFLAPSHPGVELCAVIAQPRALSEGGPVVVAALKQAEG